MSDANEVFVVYCNETPIYFAKTEEDAWKALDFEVNHMIEYALNYFQNFRFSFHRYKSNLYDRFNCIIVESDENSIYPKSTVTFLRSIYYIRRLPLNLSLIPD